MHLVVYTQSAAPVSAIFDSLHVTLQPGSSIVVAPQAASIAGIQVQSVDYASVVVGDSGAFIAYPIQSPLDAFGQGFGLGVGFLGFVLLLSLSKLISRHSPDF